VTSRALIDEFSSSDGYFNTFGGNPVSCAAALAVLDVIEGEGLQQNTAQLGAHIVVGLEALSQKYEVIGDVRGNGLFIAVELVSDRATRSPATEISARVVNDLRERGVLTGSIGPDDNILKLRPPMVLHQAEADLMLDTLDASLRAVTA
jgi:4-aminobutyrate aminotransferase-like enzyme